MVMVNVYVVTNNHTGRSYEVFGGNTPTNLDMVWNGEKYWFSKGCSVTITAPNGESKTFTK